MRRWRSGVVGGVAAVALAAACADPVGDTPPVVSDPPVDTPVGDDTDPPPVVDDTDVAPAADDRLVRRLAVRELRHMIADLVGVEVDTEGFPQDPTPNGFDNQIGGATVTPQLIDRLDLAASTAAAAWADARLHRERLEFAGDFNRGCFEDDLGEDGDTRWVSFGEEELSAPLDVPVGGTWQVRIDFAQYIGYGIDGLRTVAVRVDGAEVLRADFPGEGGRGAVPQRFSAAVDLSLTAGRHTVAWELLTPPDDAGVNPNAIPCTIFGGVSVDHVDVTGPRDLVAGCAGDDPFDASCFGDELVAFAARAWREPLDAADASALTSWFEATWAALGDPVEALATAAHRVLLSPRFLLVEDRLGPDGRRTAVDVAEQLALMAWASLPDDALTACAADGALLDAEGPCAVATQLPRLLDDPRATRMVRDLTVQWFRLDRVPAAPDDAPDLDVGALHADMIDETAALVTTLLEAGAPGWSALVEAPQSTVSPELAAWYGLTGVAQGGGVVLDAAAAGRAGVLGHGAVHTTTSRAGRVLPVFRGAWIQDVLLCNPPLPPPAGIPVLEGDDAADFDAHTALPGCASCHAELDPPGKTMGHFDAWGRAGAVAAADGVMPDGTPLPDLPALRAWILGQDAFEACATATVATNALGRRVVWSDPRVAGWQAAVDAQGGSLGTLLLEIAASPSFLAPLGEVAP